MANKYSKLEIDREKIQGWIELWCEEHYEEPCSVHKNDTKDRIKYEIHHGHEVVKLDFIKCAGGLLTMTPNVGVNISESTILAESIYNRVSNVQGSSPFMNGFSIILNEDNFNILIELIKSLEGVSLNNYSEQNQEGRAKYRQYKFTGISGDKVAIKYFPNTSRMQMQGRPLALFNEIIGLVSDNGEGLEDLVDAHIRYCCVDVKKEEIFSELEDILGKDLFCFLSPAHHAILSTSIILSRIDGYMGDFSIIVQPANRVYEGFVKKIFAQKGLTLNREEQLGKFFYRENEVTPVMKEEYASSLDEEVVKGFTDMFKFYSKHRHPYSHSTAIAITTSIIEKRETAEELMNEVFSSMIEWYKWYSNI